MKMVDNSNHGFYVNDEFRTNQLSLRPGGSAVKVNYADGLFKIYDKIKYPRAYVSKITESDTSIVSIYVDDKLFWKK